MVAAFNALRVSAVRAATSVREFNRVLETLTPRKSRWRRWLDWLCRHGIHGRRVRFIDYDESGNAYRVKRCGRCSTEVWKRPGRRIVQPPRYPTLPTDVPSRALRPPSRTP